MCSLGQAGTVIDPHSKIQSVHLTERVQNGPARVQLSLSELNQIILKLEAVLFRAQVSARFGIVIIGLRCLLLSKVAIECVKECHLFLDLVGMCIQN